MPRLQPPATISRAASLRVSCRRSLGGLYWFLGYGHGTGSVSVYWLLHELLDLRLLEFVLAGNVGEGAVQRFDLLARGDQLKKVLILLGRGLEVFARDLLLSKVVLSSGKL